MKTKFMRIASIFSYVACFFYFLWTAYAFALGDNLYWLFLSLGLVSLVSGLAVSSLIHDVPFDKKRKIYFIVASIFSFVAVIPGILNIVSLFVPGGAVAEGEVALPKPKKEKKWYKKTSFILMCASLGASLAFSFVAQIFETSGYSVSVKNFTLTKAMTEEYGSIPVHGNRHVIESDALSYGVTVYRPKFATPEYPAATVFVMPGFTRTKATMSQYAIEFSKRGAVVFVLDPGCQGTTTAAGYDESGEMISSTVESNGLNYLVHYVYANTQEFDYVDRNRIGVIGHSAGGGNAVTTAAEFAGASYNESVIKSLYISGYIKLSAAQKYKNLRCNAVNAYAYYDEGIYRYQGDASSLEVVNLRFINEVNGHNNGYTQADMVYDQAYGNIADGTYRMLHREKTNHCFQMYDQTSIVNSIAFFNETLDFGTYLTNDSLTWLGKESFNGLALVAGFVFYVSLAAVLIDLPFLKSLKYPELVRFSNGELGYCEPKAEEKAEEPKEEKTEEAALPKKKNARFRLSNKILLWVPTILTAIIACLDYIPLAALSIDWFPDAASNTYTFYFPARMFNAVLLWAGVNGLIGLVLFFGISAGENLVELIVAKVQKRAPVYDWTKFKALKIKPLDLLKTLGLSIVVFAAFFFLIQINYWIFHQDFRFMLISAAPLSWRFFVTWLEYIPILFLFYISNSIKVNLSFGLEGWKEWKVMLVSGIANSIGLVFILIINYVAFFKTGTVYYGYWDGDKEVWLYINMVFALIPMMFVLPILNRLFYKMTKKVYLGAIVNVMIFVMMSLLATVAYIPL